MYEIFYYNSGYVQFYPIIESWKIIRERDEDNPFIIRDIVEASFQVNETAYTFFEAYKGTSREVVGQFTETIGGNTTTYDCLFTVDSKVNYDTEFLTISMFVDDKYYNLLDNPEKNIETEYNLITDITTSKAKVVSREVSGTKYENSYSLKTIVDELLNDIDSSILISDGTTYPELASENYDNLFFALVDNVNAEEFSIKLKDVFDYIAQNSGLNFFYYINSSNYLVFDYIDNLVQGSYSVDLTNYNSINWAAQTPNVLEFEQKLSLIKYTNINSALNFKSVDCVFIKNAKNETDNVYNFIGDLSQTKETNNGTYALNCNETETDIQTNNYLNSSFDTYSCSLNGKTQSATNSTGGHQYAIGDPFTAELNQELQMSWNVISGGANGVIEIWDNVGGLIVTSFAMSLGSASYTFLAEKEYRLRTSITGSPKSFSIDTFEANLITYIVRPVTVSMSPVDNYELSPAYVTENYISFMPDSAGIVNSASKTGISVKPSQTEEIQFPFSDRISEFDFSKYVKSATSSSMIPYRLERTVLNLDEKGFDKITLKK